MPGSVNLVIIPFMCLMNSIICEAQSCRGAPPWPSQGPVSRHTIGRTSSSPTQNGRHFYINSIKTVKNMTEAVARDTSTETIEEKIHDHYENKFTNLSEARSEFQFNDIEGCKITALEENTCVSIENRAELSFLAMINLREDIDSDGTIEIEVDVLRLGNTQDYGSFKIFSAMGGVEPIQEFNDVTNSREISLQRNQELFLSWEYMEARRQDEFVIFALPVSANRDLAIECGIDINTFLGTPAVSTTISTTSETTTNKKQPLEGKNPSSNSITPETIAIIVVALLLLVTFIIFLLIFIRYRREEKKHPQQSIEAPAQQQIGPYEQVDSTQLDEESPEQEPPIPKRTDSYVDRHQYAEIPADGLDNTEKDDNDQEKSSNEQQPGMHKKSSKKKTQAHLADSSNGASSNHSPDYIYATPHKPQKQESVVHSVENDVYVSASQMNSLKSQISQDSTDYQPQYLEILEDTRSTLCHKLSIPKMVENDVYSSE